MIPAHLLQEPHAVTTWHLEAGHDDVEAVEHLGGVACRRDRFDDGTFEAQRLVENEYLQGAPPCTTPSGSRAMQSWHPAPPMAAVSARGARCAAHGVSWVRAGKP